MNENEYNTYLENMLLSGLYDKLNKEDVSFIMNNYYLSGLEKANIIAQHSNKKNKKKIKVLKGIL